MCKKKKNDALLKKNLVLSFEMIRRRYDSIEQSEQSELNFTEKIITMR